MPMDTLIIIRKIREAEVLADQGKHGDARRWLEPLLEEKSLSDNQRNLLSKKIDLFNKQHDRATRMMSRKSVESRGESRGETTSRDSSALSENTTVTDNPRKASNRQAAVKPRTGDTTVPGMDPIVPSHPTEALPRPTQRTIENAFKANAANTSPVLDLSRDDEDTDIENDGQGTAVGDNIDETGPTLVPPEKAASSITARDEPAPSLPPPPPPGPRNSAEAARVARSTSQIVPSQPGNAPPAPPKRRTERIREAMTSSAALRKLAEEMPNDISRELALEVARLKDEVARLSERHGALEKPASGDFKIPMSAANTVVRTATGGTDIAVQMPSRGDNAPDLEVLGRGKIRKTEQLRMSPAETIAAAPSHFVASAGSEDKLRQLAVVVGILVIVGLLSYGVWWGLQAVASNQPGSVSVTEAAVGTLRLGQDYKSHPALPKPVLRPGRVVDESNGWTAYIDVNDHVTAVTVPVSAGKPPLKVNFEQYAISVDARTTVAAVREKFGEPVPYVMNTTWNILRYEGRQGGSAIEFVFMLGGDSPLAYVRLIDIKAQGWLPDPGSGPRPEAVP